MDRLCLEWRPGAFSVPFDRYFFSFREMMIHFLEMVRTGRCPIPRAEIIALAKVVLAGDLSKKQGGVPISPTTLRAIHEAGGSE